MKKLILLMACMLNTVWASAQFSGSGSGTGSDPYLIFYADQLNQVRNYLNQDGVYFKLMSNIDLSSWLAANNPGQGWEAIGVEASPFKGVFDGNGKTISGLSISRSNYDGVGLFAYTDGATIQNLTLKGTVTGGEKTGAFVGSATSTTCTNLRFEGSVTGGNKTGGIVGSYSGSMSGCQVSGNVTGVESVGGIIGETFWPQPSTTSTSLSNCRSDATVSSSSDCVGGIVGYAIRTSFTQCYSYSTVEGRNYVGGVIGENINAGNISNCVFFGNVTGNDYVAGLVGMAGYNLHRYSYYFKSGIYLQTNTYSDTTEDTGDNYDATYNNCYAIGRIVGDNYIGGIVGSMTYNGYHIKDTFNSSHYNATGGPSSSYYYYIDGVLIESSTEATLHTYTYTPINVTNCYFSGDIEGKENVGGIVGEMVNGRVSKNYSHANVSGTEKVGGICGIITSGTVTSNMAVNPMVRGTGYVGRIYGIKGIGSITIGTNGNAAEDNRALYDTQLSINGVTQTLTDNEQHGVSNGEAYFKLKANYVGHGWDFNSDWTNQETETFPYKTWQAAPPTVTSELMSGTTSISGNSTDGGTIYLTSATNNVSTICTGTTWQMTDLNPLQSGEKISLYTAAEGKEYSYRTTATVGYPGSGTEEDPWLVYTAEDLQGVTRAGYYKQMNDIDLTDWINTHSPTTGWMPVGRSGSNATIYNGDNHQITGLWTNTTDSYTGLFSNFENGTIRNLSITVADGKEVKGGDYTGILIGKNSDGIIENVIVNGQVSGGNYVGGLAGQISSTTIRQCHADGTVTASGSFVGGLIGGCFGTTNNGVNLLQNSGFDTDMSGWTNTSSFTYSDQECEYFGPDPVDFYQNLTLEPGTYRLSAQAFFRYTGYSTAYQAYSNGTDASQMIAELYAGSNAVKLPSLFTVSRTSSFTGSVEISGNYYANSMSSARYLFDEGEYNVSLEFSLPTSQTLQVGIRKPSSSDSSWTIFDNIELVKVFDVDPASQGNETNEVSECSASGSVSTTGSSASIGGLIGSSNVIVNQCQTNVNVTASGSSVKVGGLVGDNYATTTLSFSKGIVTASGSDSFAGGLVGTNHITVENCYSEANVGSTLYAAGLVGYNYGTVDKCYASGDIASTYYGTGLVGYNDGTDATTTNSVALGSRVEVSDESGWGIRVLGGFKNSAPIPDESNYGWSGMQISVNGIPKAISDNILDGQSFNNTQRYARTSYANLSWNFTDVWNIVEGTSAPKLKWIATANQAQGIALNNTSMMIEIGTTGTLIATVTPQFAIQTVTWTSSNTDVATVNAEGTVTAVAIGEATITATTTDGTELSASCLVTVTTSLADAIADLRTIITTAQSLYDNSTEGTEVGQYPEGSRATLQVAINTANAAITNEMTLADVAQVKADIMTAIEAFESLIVGVGEDTDITMLDNVIYLNKVEVPAGNQLVLSFKMKNSAPIRGFQFDLQLPDGVTVAKNNKGRIIASLSSGRLPEDDEHTLTSTVEAGGAVRFLCGSLYDETFMGTDGEILTVTVNVSDDMAEGDYPVILRNIKLTETDISQTYSTNYLKSTLTIKSYTLGDINNDGVVDVADYIGVANHILGNIPEGFVEKAGDVDVNGVIDVADYIGIANLILFGNIYGESGSHAAPVRKAIFIGNVE